jgi:hypothetical protein
MRILVSSVTYQMRNVLNYSANALAVDWNELLRALYNCSLMVFAKQ